MRILFLAAKTHTIEPFGLMCLSPLLAQDGHTVQLLEAESEGIAEEVAKFEPDIIGYSVCTGSHNYYLSLNRWLKERQHFLAVFGGPHPTFFPNVLEEEGLDAICRGEGDFAFPEFCRELEATGGPQPVPNFSIKRNGKIESRPPRPLVQNLDSLPFADRELYYGISEEVRNHRVRSFLASRGCPFACSYCFNHAMDELYAGGWRHVRTRSPESLVAEIASAMEAHPTEFVAFRESIFPLQSAWLKEFAEVYAARAGIPFYCHVRLDLLTEENVALLAQAGCHSVNVGIETGNENLRRDLLGRAMSDETIVLASKRLRKYGIKILANNMLGLPGGTLVSDLETLRLNQRSRPDYSLAMLWQPYPGTKLAKFAERNGHFGGNYDNLDFTYYSASHLRFKDEKEKRRIENLQKLFAVAVAVPSLTWLVKLLIRLPPNRVFKAIFRTMYLMFHQTEIFPHRMGLADWLRNFRHIAKEP